MRRLIHRTHAATSIGRRLGVALLLVLYLAPVLSLWLSTSASAETPLALCCHAHGKHHCAMGGMDAEGHGNSFGAQLTERCPYQNTAPVTQRPDTLAALAQSSIPIALREEKTASPRLRPAARVRTSRAHPKRGPPASSICSHEA